jgi:ABC-type siderophore export system fused ATPase/permease subunit
MSTNGHLKTGGGGMLIQYTTYTTSGSVESSVIIWSKVCSKSICRKSTKRRKYLGNLESEVRLDAFAWDRLSRISRGSILFLSRQAYVYVTALSLLGTRLTYWLYYILVSKMRYINIYIYARRELADGWYIMVCISPYMVYWYIPYI